MNLRANLPVFAKKLIWELKYGAGKYTQETAPKDAISQLSALPDQARILELGCGRGSLLKGLRAAGWQGYYRGVDISQAAIREAAQFQNSSNSSWLVSDIESFNSHEKWDAIAMIESIYYVKIDRVPEVLRRTMGMLNEAGYLLLRIHDFSKHSQYLDAIDGLNQYVERMESLILIRPEASSTASAR
jgi:cyclopropane fatty-acyl-phospholipid synthase-like methyltransferase